MYQNVELRKLPAGVLCNIVSILEINNDWKKVMSIIPKNLQTNDSVPKYNVEQIRMIEEYAKATNLKCTEILMDEWGTSGRVRPTLSTLKDILVKAQIFRAADEIAKMLDESLPERPNYGPAAPVTMNVTEMLNDESAEQRLNNMSTVRKSSTDPIYNGSTKQMKSISDMIKFSKLCNNELPPESLQQSIGNKTTVQMKSASDLIGFSKDQPTQDSMNVPDLTAMLSTTKSIGQKPNIPTMVDSTDIASSKLNSTQSNTYSSMQYPETYQTSFPNINITTGIDSAILQDTNLIHFDYAELDHITDNFSEVLSVEPHGLKGRIGSGGFGDVFVGNTSRYGMLAVKKAHNHLAMHRKPDIAIRIFNAEVKYLSRFRHNNIVPILGFSINGPAPCIVCEYIDGGSLQQNIEMKVLNELQRINIMTGTAEGLKYLHTSENKGSNSNYDLVGETDSQNSTKNFVHGDVKTANILLTKDCVPKLCDFGLAKQYDSTFVTTCPMGTSAYMAPEGINGSITQKLDIFSFGIVLLELLTGLKPIVTNNGENLNIKHYIEENSVSYNITHLLDPVVENWTKGEEIYNLANKCLEFNRKSRPTIVEVCDILGRIKNN